MKPLGFILLIGLALLPESIFAQEARLATNCRLYPHSLPCLGYDIETAKRMVNEQDRQQAESAKRKRDEIESPPAVETMPQQSAIPMDEYGPISQEIGPWIVTCRRDRITDVPSCGLFTVLRRDHSRQKTGILLVNIKSQHLALALSVDGSLQLEAQFRIDRNKPGQFDFCNGRRSLCVINFPRSGPEFERLIQSERLLARSSAGDIYAVLGFFPEAFAELEVQSARWGAQN